MRLFSGELRQIDDSHKDLYIGDPTTSPAYILITEEFLKLTNQDYEVLSKDLVELGTFLMAIGLQIANDSKKE